MIDLSVIIPIYNGAALIGRCLDSVVGQTTRYAFEIVCVDDGSTDNSVELIENRKDSRIRVIRQQNAGPAAARNRGVEVALGRYVAYLDADDYWKDGFVETTVAFLEEHAECVAVNVAQRHLTVSGESEAPACYRAFNKPFVVTDFFAFWAEHQHVCTGSAVLRTDVVRQTSGQRAEMRVTEDLEFWLYTATFGKWGFIPEILFVSDGRKVTEKIGWVQKMKPRWYNAPSIETWQERIVQRKDCGLFSKEGLDLALGCIAQNLSYCHVLSYRTDMAHKETLRYGRHFRNGTGKLMFRAVRCGLLWWLCCRLLQWREYNR